MNQNTIEPLEGEPVVPGVATVKPVTHNRRRLLAIALIFFSAVVVIVFVVARAFTHKDPTPVDKQQQVSTTHAAQLQMPDAPKAAEPPASAPGASASAAAKGQIVPELDPGAEAKPIAVRTAGNQGGGTGSGRPVKVVNPDDSPMFADGSAPSDGHVVLQPRDSAAPTSVADAKAGLASYQRQAAELMQQLQKVTAGAGGPGSGVPPGASVLPPLQGAASRQSAPPAAALFGSLERSATPTVQARLMGDRSMVIPKGTLFTCSLTTRLVSATSGFVACQVMRNVFSDDGRVALVERGSHLDGEYRIVQVRPGVTRIPVLWTRVRTPNGVSVDLDSPATGPLGESGIGGYVDNRWGERIGAALLLSLADDALQYAGAARTNNNGDNNTLVLPNTTAQGPKLAEKVLEATINIPPLIYQNQGGLVGVYVARDLDFSGVYELKPE